VTGLADSFDAQLGPNDFVGAISLQSDGKILVGGTFDNMCGQGRTLFARLTTGTAALQMLDITQTGIAWTHSGSGPQFARVAFAYSTDGENYLPLGNGTANGNSWTLSNLDLPTGQNIFIRAQGHCTNTVMGGDNLIESVRNVFLDPAP
jgi:hypothetical protein